MRLFGGEPGGDAYDVLDGFMAKVAGRDYRLYLSVFDALERAGVTRAGAAEDEGRLMEDLRFVLRLHPDLLARAEAVFGGGDDDAPGRLEAIRRACSLVACAAVVSVLVARL